MVGPLDRGRLEERIGALEATVEKLVRGQPVPTISSVGNRGIQADAKGTVVFPDSAFSEPHDGGDPQVKVEVSAVGRLLVFIAALMEIGTDSGESPGMSFEILDPDGNTVPLPGDTYGIVFAPHNIGDVAGGNPVQASLARINLITGLEPGTLYTVRSLYGVGSYSDSGANISDRTMVGVPF